MDFSLMSGLALGLAFFCGSIPFGVLVGAMRGVDVRAVGSGNIGATNVWRALGPRAGLLAFSLDVAKGLAGPLLARALVPGDEWVLALGAVAAVLGHTFSPFLRFRGGKGIAAGLGALLGMVPAVALAALLVWGLGLLASRMISVASIAACLALVPVAITLGAPLPVLLVATLMAVVALFKHLPNLRRIRAGTEPRVQWPARARRAT